MLSCHIAGVKYVFCGCIWHSVLASRHRVASEGAALPLDNTLFFILGRSYGVSCKFEMLVRIMRWKAL